ncbi:MAG: hypothetical protein IJW29_02635 [Clostridia bacterium]|nr:hypothetical protein [Clostridia bacterium]
MKKFTKILALTLVVIMSVLTLVACATPAKEPKDAKKALEDNDYTVSLTELDEATDDGEIAMLSAYNKDGEYIMIVWYEDAKSAKESYNDLKEELKEQEEDLEESKDDLGDEAYEEAKEALDKIVIGKSGKMVWMASSKDAVKAAK